MEKSESVPVKYIHEESTHNLASPEIIVPEIIELLNPKSVLDVGCGIGTFLNVFYKSGITDVLGLDGEWVKEDQLLISKTNFRKLDLETEFDLGRKFDLVMCLEVAEHLSEATADRFISSIIKHGDTVIFSAAIKNQGGQNHINEQNIDYWQTKFRQFGYQFYDLFRPLFWNNSGIQWWYKQNMFLVVKNSIEISDAIARTRIDGEVKTYVHPEVLELYHDLYLREVKSNNELQEAIANINSGKGSLRLYATGIVKRFVNKIR